MNAWFLGAHYWREALRSRFLQAVVLISGVLMAVACLLGPISLGAGDRIARDVGLATMLLASVIVLIAGGSHLVVREIDGRSIFFIVTRPVSRGTYIAGRFVGLVLLGWAGVLVATLMVIGVLVLRGQPVDGPLFQAAAFVGLEVCVMAAVVVFFATVAGPIASMMYAFGAFLAGHAMEGILAAESLTGVARTLMNTLRWALPDLARFDMRLEAVHGTAVAWSDFGWAAAYAALYATAVLALAWASFSRRELS
jgi:ABC-type transport system involved in multi-copper enzyme maturation permease subunit